MKLNTRFKVTRPSFFGGAPSYFEALWYPHLYFYRKSGACVSLIHRMDNI